ncbi:MAG: 30S ribosomal protein S11 [bacterium]|nr:30S ribosomal protein S11 [bacterium]
MPKKKYISEKTGRIIINSSFNNTILTLTLENGDVVAWSSCGSVGFSGTKKGTPYAAQVAAQALAKKALELGIVEVKVYVKGPGPGRETAVRTLAASGLRISTLHDITPIPHNGCRPKKIRRV